MQHVHPWRLPVTSHRHARDMRGTAREGLLRRATRLRRGCFVVLVQLPTGWKQGTQARNEPGGLPSLPLSVFKNESIHPIPPSFHHPHPHPPHLAMIAHRAIQVCLLSSSLLPSYPPLPATFISSTLHSSYLLPPSIYPFPSPDPRSAGACTSQIPQSFSHPMRHDSILKDPPPLTPHSLIHPSSHCTLSFLAR